MANADDDEFRNRFVRRYGQIPDLYQNIDQVTSALQAAGLESSNLIVGIDFTASNTWNGKRTFGKQSLHAIGRQPNPYQQALHIIGRTLERFDEDNLIPCFGFGDASTTDQYVFSFNEDGSPCRGFAGALNRYQEIVPRVRLAGPTSFAPIVESAVRIVEQSGGQYHVLLIVADGEMTRPSDTLPNRLSDQEQATVDAIVAASNYALSIVMVGVGDGPWDAMHAFDDNLPKRNFDNFQFVEFSAIMDSRMGEEQKESQFALRALMEIPFQYQALVEARILGRQLGRMPPRPPLPPPPHVPHR